MNHSPKNIALFNEIMQVLTTNVSKGFDNKDMWHYGKVDIGAVVDHLEHKYTITPKTLKKIT